MTGPAGAAHAPLHILIVDDNASAAQTTGWMVELMGHSYALADGGSMAAARAFERKPDVVILDIGLPGTNGFDVCLTMKTRPDLSGTVFVAHSGYGDEKYRTRAVEVGFAHFLLKPFEMADLETVLALAADQISRSGQAGA